MVHVPTCRAKGEGDRADLDEELKLVLRDQQLLQQYYSSDMIFYENNCFIAECAGPKI